MKRLFTLCTVAAVLFTVFGQSLLVADYLARQSYYTEVFCVNKSRPAMNCNGQCHLNKELNKQEKRGDAPATPAKSKNEIFMLFELGEQMTMNVFFFLQMTSPSHSTDIPPGHAVSVFHPPKA